jgi:hypothetical protein
MSRKKIDNVEPTVENIRNGTYPFTETICWPCL